MKSRNANEDMLPEWQFGRFLIGSEADPVPCSTTVNIVFSGDVGVEDRQGWGAPAASVPIGNKTLTSYGRVSMVGCGPENNYVRLAQTARKGDNTLFFADGAVDGWKIGDKIAVSGNFVWP